jgi:hypothetical protein
MSQHQLVELNYDPLEYLDSEQPLAISSTAEATVDGDLASILEQHQSLSGCFSIIGPVAICYSVQGTNIRVSLKLAGIEVTSVNINPSNPCQKLEGNVLLAKASVQVCIKGKCLTYNAQACYRTSPFGKWKCVSKSGTIICF